MCTVSFVNSGGKIIITSNRDEQVIRPALAPQNYAVNNKNLCFPKDPKAGGTWFAVDENANVLVLLNGAAEKHHWNPPYRRSRGLIALDLLGSNSAIETWETIDLDNVEPFTLVLYQDQKLYQLRWNGAEKEKQHLEVSRNYIWSSSPLYSKPIREQRAKWFATFLDTKPEVTENEMFQFHRYTENDDSEHGLIINRSNRLQTLSITQAVLEQNKVRLHHHDLIEQRDFYNTFIQM
ncbi:NRDE family protein [Flavobacterium sp.]|uniref:NRDE family protein n=1 Tax=Flavobacterium sp. TaxID=239 RepID=UPI0026182B08|nr:NRDE family protein [Flavobacterium sp.]